MKRLIVGIVAALVVSISHSATINKKLLCENTKIIFGSLAETFKEYPYFLGEGTEDDQNTKIVLLVNPVSLSWTLVQMKDDVACILGTGDQAKFNKSKDF